MEKIVCVLIAIGFSGFLISCNQTKNTKIDQTELVNNDHYVSIDGLWRVTPETAIKYPHGTLEPIIQISGDAFGQLAIRGCFLWDGLFYDYWDLKNIQLTDSTHQIELHYDDYGVYKGVVDQKREMIQGIAYWNEKDTADWNKIDFIRDEDLDINKLFIPYPSGPHGSLIYTYHQPKRHNDQLQTDGIFEYVKDQTAFYGLMERIIRQEFGRLESLLIIKDQNLVLEEYFFGYDRTQLHCINSCTKSIISLLLGVSLERNKRLDMDEPVFNFFPQYDSLIVSGGKEITLEHVLTMTSGLTDEDDFEKNNQDDVVKQMLCQPLESAPGEKFKYNNNGTNLLGSIIYTLENKQADEFAKEVLFNKLGIWEFYWEKENGVLQCHNGLHMYPRDMAKIGLLVLNDGYWKGEQIIPKKWIDMSAKPSVPESAFFDYGYQWWYRSKQNKSWWNDPVHGSIDEHDMFLALGFGGQYIMVIKDMNMVIVTTSSDNNESNGLAHAKVPMVIEEIIPLFD